ncbi:uracil-DNA glycosylase [Alpinimonas psychrophila]|uniref:Uracil-DNA glycosylase n=1 Tax=Alpinimonas psychrophila TaxID=748908 RepID=A0A7W3JU76_9MICO|nr:uracil-DNA glycosylase [Alpinimonas psychrophila]MBA8829235.1 uracil-DNA glycosylase [Alpinimonas psychrophila]
MTSNLDLEQLRDDGVIDASWATALAPVQSTLDEIAVFLQQELASGVIVLPEPRNIMRVFNIPVNSVRVLIVGQDPYPTPGHPIGLAFAVDEHVRTLPRSLNNIFTELETDTGHLRPATGGLGGWTNQGVMLLNRVLTVRAGEAGSHRGNGWEAVTERAIKVLATRNSSHPGTPLVAILWGKQAASLRPLLGETPIVESAHPSPLSASRGFFGSKPFTRTNEALTLQGPSPIDWSGLG